MGLSQIAKTARLARYRGTAARVPGARSSVKGVNIHCAFGCDGSDSLVNLPSKADRSGASARGRMIASEVDILSVSAIPDRRPRRQNARKQTSVVGQGRN